ncbi:MAG: diadenylate cyclase CdaA [Candidatus Margulisiibacteriota bacterium]
MTHLLTFVPQIHWNTWIDLAVVYLVMYYFLIWIKDTPSFNVIRGLFLVLCIYVFSWFFHLTTLHWLLERFANILILIVIIIFQPEFRRALEKIGRGRVMRQSLFLSDGQGAGVIKHILRAAETLSKQKIGALMVIERGDSLAEYSESGIMINAHLSSELLISLFWPLSPTHDGAVIIRENQIVSAECLLPLTDSKLHDRRLGTRHRAALGLSEETDALIIVISEETGVISLAENGTLTRYLNREALETRLFDVYSEGASPDHQKPFWQALTARLKGAWK